MNFFPFMSSLSPTEKVDLTSLDSTADSCCGFNSNIGGSSLDLIDSLRRTGIELDNVSLPQIVVVGDQSSGKSSVLEALSGIPFPRGASLVTRCPTEVKMKRASSWKGKIKLSGEESRDSKVLHSPQDISRRIEELTKQLTDTEKGIETNRSIQIEVFSPDVSDLTVIDLPGIVRRRMDGQSETVIEDVDSLLQRYLEQPRTVILAVIPSNVDIATVDIIERASKVDPEFKRTIGVFTKPDMMDSGHLKEKVKILKGKEPSIRLSCTVLRNRGPDEIEAGVSLSQAKKIEADYFKSHEKFKKMDPTLFGIDHFSQKLNIILTDSINASLPDVEREVTNKLQKATADLRDLGEVPPSDKNERLYRVDELISSITDDIESAVNGNYTPKSLLKDDESKIYALFQSLADECKEELIKGTPDWEVKDLIDRIRAMKGRELPGFFNYDVFTIFVKDGVEKWRKPVMDFLQSTIDVVTTACHIIISHHTKKRQQMGSDFKKIVDDLMPKYKQVESSLSKMIDMEMMPHTMDETFKELQNKEKFIQFENFIAHVFKRYNKEETVRIKDIERLLSENFRVRYSLENTSNEIVEAEHIKGSLRNYWNVKISPFGTSVMRAIDESVIEKLHIDIEKELRNILVSKDTDFEKYFYEHPSIQQKRKILQASIDRLIAAKKEFRRIS